LRVSVLGSKFGGNHRDGGHGFVLLLFLVAGLRDHLGKVLGGRGQRGSSW